MIIIKKKLFKVKPNGTGCIYESCDPNTIGTCDGVFSICSVPGCNSLCSTTPQCSNLTGNTCCDNYCRFLSSDGKNKKNFYLNK